MPTPIYHYSSESGEFLREDVARESPLEPGKPLLPAHATFQAPPAAQEGKARVYINGVWQFVDDQRGWYFDAQRRKVAVDQLGADVSGLVKEAPPSECHDLVGGVWTPNAGTLAKTKLAALADEYEARMQVIAADYPPSERESWPVQMQEAQALLADSQASTPWIDAAAAARGLGRAELATRIANKNAAYRVVSGTLTGVRQAIEDQITAAAADPQALASIDVTAGWPTL